MKLLSCLALASTLAGCGGGSGSDSDAAAYQQAVDLANAKEAEARALAVEGPCAQVSECGTVAFLSPVQPCANWTYKPYSLVSATAVAASAAAAEQRKLAGQAGSLAPPPNTACAAMIAEPPSLSCTAEKCRAI
jgi:hypothetical protein